MTGTAILVAERPIHWMGDTNIYAVDPPYQGWTHVAVMVWPVHFGQWQSAGTEIVGCDENGVVPGDGMSALWQSYEVLAHADALAAVSYQISASPNDSEGASS